MKKNIFQTVKENNYLLAYPSIESYEISNEGFLSTLKDTISFIVKRIKNNKPSKEKTETKEENKPGSYYEYKELLEIYNTLVDNTGKLKPSIGVKTEVKVTKDYSSILFGPNQSAPATDIDGIIKNLEAHYKFILTVYKKLKPDVKKVVDAFNKLEKEIESVNYQTVTADELIAIFRKYKDDPNLNIKPDTLMPVEWKKYIQNMEDAEVSQDVTIQVSREKLNAILAIAGKFFKDIELDMVSNDYDHLYLGFDYTDPPFRGVSDTLFESDDKEVNDFMNKMYLDDFSETFKVFEQIEGTLFGFNQYIQKLIVKSTQS